jgi:hypothetical protein
MIEILQAIKTDLTGMIGIQSVGIGIEPDINPNDYPAIRIVPLVNKPDNNIYRKTATIDVFVGFTEFPQALEESYATLYGWANEIITRLQKGTQYTAFWQQTLNDEDRLPAAKLICVSFEVVY